jgi:hypothetical protein
MPVEQLAGGRGERRGHAFRTWDDDVFSKNASRLRRLGHQHRRH